jgi:hypothetical protein
MKNIKIMELYLYQSQSELLRQLAMPSTFLMVSNRQVLLYHGMVDDKCDYLGNRMHKTFARLKELNLIYKFHDGRKPVEFYKITEAGKAYVLDYLNVKMKRLAASKVKTTTTSQ